MGFGTTNQQAWCTAIPDLALRHDFVVHGVLAITALHLSMTANSVEGKEGYLNMVAAELNIGLMRYVNELQRVTSENTEALFAFSTAISLYSTCYSRGACQDLLRSVHANLDTSPLKTVSATVQIFCRAMRTLRGAQVILVPGWSKLQSGRLGYVVQRPSWEAATPVTEAHAEDYRRLRNLELMWSNPNRAYEDHFDILRQAWQGLCGCFTLVWSLIDNAPLNHSASGPSFDWTSIFHFPVQCSLSFVNLLEQHCVEAWVLMAHYAVLHAKVGGLWWLDGSAANIMGTAALVIGTNNWEWIAWPAAQTGYDLEGLRSSTLDRPKVAPESCCLPYRTPPNPRT